MSNEQSGSFTGKNTITSQDVSRKNREHADGVLAEMEVEPHNESLMSLGTFEADNQPKGFCLEFKNGQDAQGIVSEITSRARNGHSQYLLHVVNNTAAALSVEVRQL